VYLYRVPIEADEAPFEQYQDLARAALGAVELELPAQGTVVLKPNITVLFPAARRITTHPGFIAGMLEALVEKGVPRERLVVAEGQAGEQPEHGHTWEKSGYREMIARQGVRLALLNGVETRRVEVPGGVVYDHFPMAREVTDCAFFFNVPVAKCHNLVCTTLSVKNLMGTLLSPVRHICSIQKVDEPHAEGIWRLAENGLSIHENRFCDKLCDLVSALRSLKIPRLCVIDGLIGRDGTAFNEGGNYPLGWTAMGENEVHVDAVATHLMGLDPARTPYLRRAAQRGLGTNRVEEIEVVDLRAGRSLRRDEVRALRRAQPLMPVCRWEGGYYPRFRADGSVVPWNLNEVNNQRRLDGLEPLAPEEPALAGSNGMGGL
jgi:uncharacterized protein (DUF362 family)